MLSRVITLHFNTAIGQFDDTPLREFIKDKEILSIRDHFFIKNEMPYLALVVKYNMLHPAIVNTRDDSQGKQQKRDDSWRELLKESDMPLFNSLRDWRNELGKKEGLPPYIMFTNKQIALIAKERPQNGTKLGEIEGIGKAKVEKYGKEILAIISTKVEPQTKPESANGEQVNQDSSTVKEEKVDAGK